MDFWWFVAKIIFVIILVISGGSSASSMLKGIVEKDYALFGLNVMLIVVTICGIVTVMFK